jgi:hypothetical protein
MLQYNIILHKVLLGIPEGKKQVWKTKEDNIRTELADVWLQDVCWINLDSDRDNLWALVNSKFP